MKFHEFIRQCKENILYFQMRCNQIENQNVLRLQNELMLNYHEQDVTNFSN